MRSTTEHVTGIMVPIAATASRNAVAAEEAALSTSQLATGIGAISTTAQSLRQQAEYLESLLAKFTVVPGESTRPAGSAPVRSRELAGR